MTTASTDQEARIKIIGAHGQLTTDEPEQMLIELIRDHLAEYRPDKFISNWDELNIGNQVACLIACANSRNYMEENFMTDPEIKELLAKLEPLRDRTDPEPLEPEEILRDFREQADRDIPGWEDLPRMFRIRFTDYHHHSIKRQETGKLGWLDVEMMLTFWQRHGHALEMPASFKRARQNLVNPAFA